jgi:hypothetical protein
MIPVMRYCILALFMMFSLTSHAQSFAPEGAEWVYNTSRGIFHAKASRDTTINGTVARVIAYTPHIDSLWTSYGYWMQDIADEYVYDNGDTVFVYEKKHSRFTPLYIFNVADGDTVTLPAMQPVTGMFYNSSDTMYRFVVDSVRTLPYGTRSLKTVYTRTLAESGMQDLRYEVYAEKLGNLNSGIRPTCHSCNFILSDNDVAPGEIRCYTDATMSINFVNGDCYKGIRVSVPATPALQQALLYPNPATSEVHIKLGRQLNVATIQLLDMHGAIISSQVISNGSETSFDVQSLTQGIYLIRIADDTGAIMHRKIVVGK